jgi:hypothetical protein
MYKRFYKDALRMYTADNKTFEEEIGVACAKQAKYNNKSDEGDGMPIQ